MTKPDKPRSLDRHLGERLPVRLPVDVIHAYRVASALAGVTLADWVRSALADKLNRSKKDRAGA